MGESFYILNKKKLLQYFTRVSCNWITDFLLTHINYGALEIGRIAMRSVRVTRTSVQ